MYPNPSELVQSLSDYCDRLIAERNKLRSENDSLQRRVQQNSEASLQSIVAELRQENNEAFDRILELTKQVSDAHEELHKLEDENRRLRKWITQLQDGIRDI